MQTSQIQGNGRTSPILLPSTINYQIPPSLKVDSLFAVRHINDNIQFVCSKETDRRWIINNLRSLQYSIYELDRCGELNWIPSNNILDRLWTSIYKQLSLFGLGKQEIKLLLHDMQAYQRVEALLREGRSPTEVPIQEFYYLKTCDVRLARKLITLVTQHKNSTATALAWTYYDLASEICDDLTDTWEDSSNFNCNRFSIRRRISGETETREEYGSFLQLIKAQAYELAKGAEESGLPAIIQVCQWAVHTINKGEVLLEHCLKTPLVPVLAFQQKYLSSSEIHQIVKRYMDGSSPTIQNLSKNHDG